MYNTHTKTDLHSDVASVYYMAEFLHHSHIPRVVSHDLLGSLPSPRGPFQRGLSLLSDVPLLFLCLDHDETMETGGNWLTFKS